MSKQFLAFVNKEFYHIIRDRRTMLILLGMPIVQILIFGFAINMEVQNIRIAIYEPQTDVYTQDLTARIKSNPYFILKEAPHSIHEIDEQLSKGKIDMALIFPNNFHNDLVHAGKAQIQVIADSSDPNIGTISTNYIRAIIGEQQREWMNLQQIPYNINVTSKLHYNPEMKSAYTFVPGIMGLVLMIICAIMTSISIVREKEMGTYDIHINCEGERDGHHGSIISIAGKFCNRSSFKNDSISGTIICKFNYNFIIVLFCS